jgi:hypothetical protein
LWLEITIFFNKILFPFFIDLQKLFLNILKSLLNGKFLKNIFLKYWQTEKIILFLQPVNQPLTKAVNVV